MPKPKMTRSLQMIASYKEHASPDNQRRIDRLAQMYERYLFPSRKPVICVCRALTAEEEPTRTKGLLMYERYMKKYSKPYPTEYYTISSSSDDEQEDSTEDAVWDIFIRSNGFN